MSYRCALLWGQVLVLVLSVPAFGGPKLELDPTTYEWGRQATNEGMYTFTFTLKNVGDEQLEITRVRPGCGCTKVELKTRSLAPQESTELTGTLKTKGVEGKMRKGIILTTNDPDRKTSIASLDIRFPYEGEGLRFKYSKHGARLRRGALWAYVYVENCEPETPINIQALELPPGWDCADKIPLTVPPENRQALRLFRNLEEGVEPEAFDDLDFKILCDFEATRELSGKLVYRPRRAPSTQVTKSRDDAGDSEEKPVVRWPMTTPLEESDDQE